MRHQAFLGNVQIYLATVIVAAVLELFSSALAEDGAVTTKEPLKGGVEDTNVLPTKHDNFKGEIPMEVPVLKKKLDGQLDHSDRNALEGRTQDDGDPNLQGQSGQPDKQILQGNAQQLEGAVGDNEESADKELSVEWDAWRNRFLRAVQSDVQSNLNNSDEVMAQFDPRQQTVIKQFPVGTVAWFKCDIREDRKIVNFELVKSSGYPSFDRIVMDAVAALNGTDILRFPTRSKRHKVNQIAGIQTSTKSTNEYFHFGDVEKYRVPDGR